MKKDVKWRRSAVALAAASSLAMLAACSSNPGTDGTDGPEPSSGTEHSTTLLIADQETPVSVSVDVYSGANGHQVGYNVYGRLLTYRQVEIQDGIMGDDIASAPEDALEGWLAESWEQLDSTTMRIYLREGVLSPTGNELTSDDVAFTIERALDLGLSSASTMSQASIIGATPVDEYTVDIHTSIPSNFAPKVFGMIGILDSEAVKSHMTDEDPWGQEWLTHNTAGFGPYKLKEANPGTSFTFDLNPNYFGETPQFTEVKILEVPSESDRVALLSKGDVDIAQSLSPQQRNHLKDVDGVTVLSVVEAGGTAQSLALTPNTTREPFGDNRVRQAMAYLIPYSTIIDNVYHGEAAAREDPVAAGFLEEQNRGLYWTAETNPEKARELLAEAGYPNGFSTSLIYDSSQPGHEQVASLLVSAFAEAGIELELKAQAQSTYSDTMGSRDFDIMMTHGGPLTPSVPYEIDLWFKSTQWVNLGGYNNPEIDDLIAEITQEFDNDRYNELVREALEILAEDQPRPGIVNTGHHFTFRSDLEGYHWKFLEQQYDWTTFTR